MNLDDIKILFEDDAMLVIFKPAGVVVNRAESVTDPTIQDWVEKSNKLQVTSNKDDIEKVFIQRSGIAHRLDRETSGILLIAKDPKVLSELMRQFKEREIEKEYLALAHGWVEPNNGWFQVPIKRKGIRLRKFGIDAWGKPALTYYRVNQKVEYEAVKYTLLTLFPKTGRTHQIRVHLSFYHFPIVSDGLYASEKMLNQDLKWCPRHFLHASKITFNHPTDSKKKMVIKAPLPSDLMQALSKINCQYE